MTNLFVKTLLFLLVITIPFYVSAHSTGAATCDVNQMATSGHGQSQASDFSTFGGYAITTAKSGQQIAISITGTTNVEGVLLYTQDSSGRTGTFTIPTGYQSKSCGGSGTNTLTHTSSASKNMPIKFMWTPPSSTSGNITVSGIVVRNYNNWYKLQDVSFNPTVGTSTVSNVTSPDTGSSSSGSVSGSDSGVGSWFKNYLLFIVLMIIVVILYIVSSVTEAMLKNQRAKAKYYRNN
ncbi:603_t:CDS:1 [Dentiscutata erythropus]|uniref:603_t:CDS:1 n=1 Tax=Dentiscutata erythropus TaxID=1348616 RepID=A0A9N9INN7_9GLOM|nr:603_t:CDS:1 [Dentiscutata erythropus]